MFCFYKLNSIFVARISNILNLKSRYYVTIRFFKIFVCGLNHLRTFYILRQWFSFVRLNCKDQ